MRDKLSKTKIASESMTSSTSTGPPKKNFVKKAPSSKMSEEEEEKTHQTKESRGKSVDRTS